MTMRMREGRVPLDGDDYDTISQVTLHEARIEVRDVMLQYTKCADPTEREARKERPKGTPEKPTASQRLGPINQDDTAGSDQNISAQKDISRERIPATSRLVERPSPSSQPRVPASLS
ncbi:hypothetical protein DY000_02039072 [Brassica cretica]|uniref:NET domain-containing protein n=1 Tax=Brassica cretica TaxID=69181 RepID=A0ABQ7BGC9_BRACR|nr:hypothetical protein DY000_02039072 [Brassica cretica]